MPPRTGLSRVLASGRRATYPSGTSHLAAHAAAPFLTKSKEPDPPMRCHKAKKPFILQIIGEVLETQPGWWFFLAKYGAIEVANEQLDAKWTMSED